MAHYKLIEELGKGGMGIVFRAHDPELRREVAIKFLLGSSEFDAVAASRFKREMNVLINLSHPNIVKVLDAGCVDGKLYYVMELLKAKDLKEILKEKGRFPPAEALHLLDQVLDALDYVHQKGLVHRDVKPANIMLVGAESRAVLMDFGVVRKLEGTLLTEEGRMVGTPRYFAPEVLHGESAGAKADLWAAGIVAYELLAGSPPFDEKTISELAASILNGRPAPLGEVCPDLPHGTEEFVARFLEKKPEDRWASAGAAREALAGIRGVEIAQPVPQRVTSKRRISTAARRPTGPVAAVAAVPRRGPRVGPVVAAALALGVLGLVWFATARPRPPVVVVPHSRPERVKMTYVALDRLAVEFTTRTPCRWDLDHGGLLSAGSIRSDHRFEIEVPPLKPVDGLALVAVGEGPDPSPGAKPWGSSREGERVELASPLHAGELVRHLDRAVRATRLSPATLDAAWTKIRATAQRSGRKHPWELGGAERACFKPLTDLAADVQTNPAVAENLALLRPHLGAVLTSRHVPEPIREILVSTLERLDWIDSMAGQIGIDPLIGVEELLAPCLTIRAALRTTPTALVMSGERRIFPAPGKKPLMVWFPPDFGLDGPGKLTEFARSVQLFNQDYRGFDNAIGIEFEDARPSPAGLRKYRIYMTNITGQTYLRLTPPGSKVLLPIRLPDGWPANASGNVVLEITVKGALAARVGRWTGDHFRVVAHGPRPFFTVDAIVDASR